MKDRLGLYLIKILGLFSLTSLRFLATCIGMLLWSLRTRAARTTVKNISLCFPTLTHSDQTQLARVSLQETVKTMFEAALIWKKNWSWLREKIVVVEGETILRSKLAEQKGVIVLVPHIGNWELTGPFLSSITPITFLYQPLKNPLTNDVVVRGRQKNSLQLAPTNLKGVAQLFRVLRSGGAVGILPDQVPDRNSGGELAPFLGRPAMTMTLIHSLIQRTGCLVCCCYAERVTGGFKIVITDVEKDIYSENLQRSLTALNNAVATCVLRAPTQYQWEYKRFRRLPPHYGISY